MSHIEIEEYDGPAIARTGATHIITVEPGQEGEPTLELMPIGHCFQNEDGPVLEIVLVLVKRHHARPNVLHRRTHEIHHTYLAKEVRI